jgi:hypothetical protein
MAVVEDFRAEWLEFTSHEDAIAETCGMLNAVTARLVRQIAVVLERDWWRGDGIRSAAHWVALKCNVSLARARGLVAIAARVADLPVSVAAFEAGRLSEDSTALICGRCPAHNDAELADFARHATVSQLRRVLAAYPLAPLPGDDVREPAPERRRVHRGPGWDSDWRITGVLPADEAATVDAAFDRARYDLEHDPDRPKDIPVSEADAFVHLCESYLTHGEQLHPTAERARVFVHLDGAVDPDRPGHLHLGSVLPGWVRRYVTCDSDVEVVFDRDRRPLALGHKQHTVPRWLRRAIEHRDGGCVVPGCPARRRLHIHHIRHWEHGGPTDEWNLVALCRWHHRLHHKGLIGITGTATDLEITDHWGHPIRAKPARPPDHPPDLPHETFQRPSGERLNTRWLSFSERPPSD